MTLRDLESNVELAPLSSEPEPPTRRPFGLEDVVTPRTAFGFFAFLYFVFALNWIVGCTTSPVARALGVWLVFVGIWLSIRNMTLSVRAPKLFLTIVLFLSLVLLLESTPSTASLFRLFKSLALLSLGGGIIVGFLGITRLLSPPKGTLLFFTLAIALAMADLALFTIRSRRAPAAPPFPVEQAPLEEVLVPSNDVAWIGPVSMPDEDLEHRYVPDSLFMTAYPSNPRHYFRELPIYGLLEPRMWKLNHSVPGMGRIRFIGSDPTVIRVEPEQIGEGKPWNVMLQQGHLPMTQGQRYVISFRARADRARNLDLAVLREGAEGKNLGLYAKAPLTTEWTNFTRVFRPLESDPKAMLVFNMGEDVAPIELRGIAFERTSNHRTGPLDMRLWELSSNSSGQAELNVPPTSNGTALVRVLQSPSADPWSIQLLQSSHQIWGGKTYNYSFRVRVEKPRELQLVLTQSSPDWTNAGLHVQWSLKPGWNYLGGEFRARLNDPEVRFAFAVGGSPATFEFGDVRLWSADDVHANTPEPVRHAVTYKINSAGFRDSNHPIEPPPGTFRIACLGDSVTFGQGVHEEDTFVRRLEANLNSRFPNGNFETMNFGVCGYSTKQERKCYEKLVANYKPHLVLITMIHNDNMSYSEEERLGLHGKPTLGEGLLGSIEQQVRQSAGSTGYQVCVDEVLKLKELCDGAGTRLVVLLFRDTDYSNWKEMEETVTSGLAGSGVPILNLKDKLAVIPFTAISVLPDVDGHPNEISHGIAATEIAQFLEQRKLLSPLPPPAPPTNP